MNVFGRIKDWSDSRGISQQEVSQNQWYGVIVHLTKTYEALEILNCQGYVLHKVEELIEYCEAKLCNDENGSIDAIADSVIFDTTEMIKEGYDIEKVLNEVLLVVESRIGKWNETNHKFEKDKSPEAQAKWYKPDYVKNCKAIENKTSSLFGYHHNSSERV